MKNDRSATNGYSTYKDSGIEWLGNVPEHWTAAKAKNVCSHIKDGTHGSFSRVDIGYPLLSVRNIVNSKFIFLTDDSLISEEDYKAISKSLKIKKGDLQLAIVGATMGKVALVSSNMTDFVTQRSLATLRPIIKVLNGNFFFYFASSSYFQDILWSNTSYSAQPGIYLNSLSNIDILIPPISEQKAIGHYLDTKTAQIDRKIDLLTQKATLYGNLKQSLINETVTRGLDKSVAMKDSGIESIRGVPEHWSIRRIKEVAYINKSTLSEKTPNNYEFDYIDIGSVTYGVKEFSSERMTFENSPSRAKRIVNKGDTIISTVRTYLKAITYINHDASNLIVSTGFAVISPKKVLFSKYFSYLSTSNFVIDKTCASSTGVSYPAINSSVIADLFCLIPPLSEQKAIADYLDTKTAKIDQITQTINTQIEKLKELRKTLINDVVTGKIKVIDNGELIIDNSPLSIIN